MGKKVLFSFMLIQKGKRDVIGNISMEMDEVNEDALEEVEEEIRENFEAPDGVVVILNWKRFEA